MRDIYTLYKNSSSNYQASGFVATIAGFPAPFSYTAPDYVYYFPEAYGKPRDSSIYSLTISIPGTATIKRNGYRLTTTIGYGTVKTPFYTSGQECILVKSETHEIDSVSLTAIPFPLGFPQNNVEYKWLIKGQHYPAVDIVAPIPFTGTITSLRYRDVYHYFPPLAVNQTQAAYRVLNAYPVPANDKVTIAIPEDWKQYSIEVYDMQSKLVFKTTNNNTVSLSALAAGNYVARIICGTQTAFVHLSK